jgi:hypothetical protein
VGGGSECGVEIGDNLLGGAFHSQDGITIRSLRSGCPDNKARTGRSPGRGSKSGARRGGRSRLSRGTRWGRRLGRGVRLGLGRGLSRRGTRRSPGSRDKSLELPDLRRQRNEGGLEDPKVLRMGGGVRRGCSGREASNSGEGEAAKPVMLGSEEGTQDGAPVRRRELHQPHSQADTVGVEGGMGGSRKVRGDGGGRRKSHWSRLG